MAARSVDDYIARLPSGQAAPAQKLRAAIIAAAPDLTEAIRYGMPAFRRGDVTVVYFAVWAKHIGVYAVYRGDAAFEALVKPYRAKVDSLHFALDQPIPEGVVAAIVRAQGQRAALPR